MQIEETYKEREFTLMLNEQEMAILWQRLRAHASQLELDMLMAVDGAMDEDEAAYFLSTIPSAVIKNEM